MITTRSVGKRRAYPVIRWLAIVLLGGVVVSACAPTPPPALDQALIGSGDLRVGIGAQKKFKTYRKQRYPAFFAISEDGRATGWTYCKDGPDGCAGHVSRQQEAINYCARYGGRNCKLFARGWEIIWQGAVTYDGLDPSYREEPKVDKLLIPAPGKNKALKKLSLKEICAVAVDYSSRPYDWSAKPGAADYVTEAKGRNLFIYQCAFETGNQ